MKTAILACLLLASFIVVVLSDATPYYTPEQQELVVPEQAVAHGHRSKRYAPGLPFLVGVAAGGIFGPILYNRLYGNRAVYYEEPRGWSAPVVVNNGWGSGGY